MKQDVLPKIRNSIYFGDEPVYCKIPEKVPFLVNTTSIFTSSSASSLESYYHHQEMIRNGEAESLVQHQASINYNYTINLVKMN